MSSFLDDNFGCIMGVFGLLIVIGGPILFAIDPSLCVLVELPLGITTFGIFMYQEEKEWKNRRLLQITLILGVTLLLISVFEIIADNVSRGVDPFALYGNRSILGIVTLLLGFFVVFTPIIGCTDWLDKKYKSMNIPRFRTPQNKPAISQTSQVEPAAASMASGGRYYCLYCNKSFSSEQSKNDHEKWCKRKIEESKKEAEKNRQRDEERKRKKAETKKKIIHQQKTSDTPVAKETIIKETVREIYLIRCEHCGHKNEAGNRFCGKCGASI